MIRRGDLFVVALVGDNGKPRPAVVVQSEVGDRLPSVVVCPLTTTLRPDLHDLRITVEPTPANGLKLPSQIMVDKPVTTQRTKLGDAIGTLEQERMGELDRALAVLLGLA